MLRRFVLLGLVLTACTGRSGSEDTSRPVSTSTSTSTAPTTTTSTAMTVKGPGNCPELEPAESADRDGSALSIQMVSDQQGWAVGNGTILHTDDGRHWIQQHRGPEQFVSVNAVDAAHAWAVGTHELLGTTDGGRTWSRLGSPAAGLLVVHFAGPDLGWGVGAKQLFRSTDGGRTWEPLATPCGAEAVCFTAHDDGWVGAGDRIWRSTDGGATWSAALDVPGARGFSMGLPVHDLQCARPGAVWAYFTPQHTNGALGHSAYVAYQGSATGGWTPVMKENYVGSADVEAPNGGSYPGPFSSLGPSEAVFITYTPPVEVPVGMVIASEAGRKLSQERPVPGLNEAYSASFRSRHLGWVVGRSKLEDGNTGASVILATRDGGRTWEEQYRA